jgi:hypothetical protein
MVAEDRGPLLHARVGVKRSRLCAYPAHAYQPYLKSGYFFATEWPFQMAGLARRKKSIMNYKKMLVAASLTFAAATLTSMVFTSYASAQCADCSIYPNRDPFTEGLKTPEAEPPGVVAAPPHATNPRATNNANAEMHGHRGQARATPSPAPAVRP